jgi:hypothetical protein
LLIPTIVRGSAKPTLTQESAMNIAKKLAGFALIVATFGMLTSCVVEARRPYYARYHHPVVYVVR